MITSNKMPELAATDIVKLRNGKIGIVLGNERSDNHLAIYTNTTICVSCKEYLSNYELNIHNDDHGLDIIKVWKSNFERQYALIDEFYTKNSTPTYMNPDWEEPTTMTVKEIEKIIGHPFTVIEEEVGEDE
jgi:hypothetical protein